MNDVHNCGQCGNDCPADKLFCDGMGCTLPPCKDCMNGDLCCVVQKGGPTMGPMCTPPENGTCPKGCPACL